jgi:hypothetical protein
MQTNTTQVLNRLSDIELSITLLSTQSNITSLISSLNNISGEIDLIQIETNDTGILTQLDLIQAQILNLSTQDNMTALLAGIADLQTNITYLRENIFYTSNLSQFFSISGLVTSTPKYPNENAIISATFANKNGSVVPDTINMTIWKPNYLVVWYAANKTDFAVDGNIWTWIQSIEASPTSGTYYVNMRASYQGYVDSKTIQFRIATGGPYKVFLECPDTAPAGANMECNLSLLDEGEVPTEATTTIWLDTNNDGVVDAGEPQTSFSKETQPQENVSQVITIFIPVDQVEAPYVVRASTEYLGSGQPNSEASDSVLITIQPLDQPPQTGGGTRGGELEILGTEIPIPAEVVTFYNVVYVYVPNDYMIGGLMGVAICVIIGVVVLLIIRINRGKTNNPNRRREEPTFSRTL